MQFACQIAVLIAMVGGSASISVLLIELRHVAYAFMVTLLTPIAMLMLYGAGAFTLLF